MLDQVYGHHHPDHLRAAAHALSYGRRRQSLVETLADTLGAVHSRPNALKSVVGPGAVPRPCNFNNLHCQTSLTARTGAKGIFLRCQTGQLYATRVPGTTPDQRPRNPPIIGPVASAALRAIHRGASD
jgi:hypothetical protein